MKTKLQTKNVLIIDTVIILAFSVALVFSNIFLIEYTNKNLNEIDQSRLNKLELVQTMTRIVRERSVLMLKMYIEKDAWERDELFLKFHKVAGGFIGARDKLTDTALVPSEKKQLLKILSIVRETEALQNDIVGRIHSGQLRDVHTDIPGKDIPKELELLGQLEDLSNTIIINSQRERVLSKEKYEKLVLFVEVLSVLIILTITVLMLRSLKRVGDIEKNLIAKTESLSRDATHDPLTNIYNRRWLKYKIERLHSNQNNALTALLYIDLDGFKPINDEYGHTVGDQYLIRFCREIEHTIRQIDTFCRLGGDEFAVLLENCSSEEATRVARDIVERISRLTVEIDGLSLMATCSIGLYQLTDAQIDFNEIVKQADALCYRAKREGKNRVVTNQGGKVLDLLRSP